MINKDYFLFIRVSKEEYIDALQRSGHIYCNTVKYYREIDDASLQGDKNEGKGFLKQIENVEILINDQVIGMADKSQLYFEDATNSGNIFCLYGVQHDLIDFTKQTLQKIEIEERSKGFGNYALIIHNPKEFVNRMFAKLNLLSQRYEFHIVTYYDKASYEGRLNPFFKSNEYSYQNELRLWIANELEEPFDFYIGDISDISSKVHVSKLNTIEVQIKDASS